MEFPMNVETRERSRQQWQKVSHAATELIAKTIEPK